MTSYGRASAVWRTKFLLLLPSPLDYLEDVQSRQLMRPRQIDRAGAQLQGRHPPMRAQDLRLDGPSPNERRIRLVRAGPLVHQEAPVRLRLPRERQGTALSLMLMPHQGLLFHLGLALLVWASVQMMR